jgi:divalent metal cation (Fe/Co/Zn/Cd) transporter
MLGLVTIFYNLAEGAVSMVFGIEDETLSLSGFGADSLIEVMSGLGITVMVMRISRDPHTSRSRFEVTALRITGTSFFLLSAGLVTGIVLNIIYHRRPVTTFWGIIISLISIVAMIWLLRSKIRVGKKLHSDPVIADANCTRVCVYMSLVLLISSLIYELTGFEYADTIGAAGLIYFSVTEGIEAFKKAKEMEDYSPVERRI